MRQRARGLGMGRGAVKRAWSWRRVKPVSGSRQAGAIWWAGPSTKSRSRKRGWGMISRDEAQHPPLHSTISRSSTRALQRWARRANPTLSVSPLGILIDPEFGLWHALRGALLYRERLEFATVHAQPSPCETCAARPCLKTCPVGAFKGDGYDVVSCRSYLATLSGQPCMIQGCQARLACPVGREHAYRGGLAQHLMRAFARG